MIDWKAVRTVVKFWSVIGGAIAVPTIGYLLGGPRSALLGMFVACAVFLVVFASCLIYDTARWENERK